MDVAEVRDQLARINGIAERSELICSDYWLARAVAEGVIHRVACGRYALPGIASAERAALKEILRDIVRRHDLKTIPTE